MNGIVADFYICHWCMMACMRIEVGQSFFNKYARAGSTAYANICWHLKRMMIK